MLFFPCHVWSKFLSRMAEVHKRAELAARNIDTDELLNGQFEEAVLLCEVSRDTVQVIHLPKSFFERYGRQTSRDRNGQVKFNVAARDGRFSVQVPDPIGWIDVTEYADTKPLICPRFEHI